MTQDQEIKLIMECYGIAVRERRNQLGWSQTELGNRSGTCRDTVSKTERAVNEFSVMTLWALTYAMETTMEQIGERAIKLYQDVLDKKGIKGEFDPRVYMKKKRNSSTQSKVTRKGKKLHWK